MCPVPQVAGAAVQMAWGASVKGHPQHDLWLLCYGRQAGGPAAAQTHGGASC